MCLGIPGRIAEVWTEASAPMAHADFAGTAREMMHEYGVLGREAGLELAGGQSAGSVRHEDGGSS
jgi:hydrogenase maturation factor